MNTHRLLLIVGLLFCLKYSFAAQQGDARSDARKTASEIAQKEAIRAGIGVLASTANKGADVLFDKIGARTTAEQAQIDYHNEQTKIAIENLKSAEVEVAMKRLELLKVGYSLTGKGSTTEAKIKQKRYEKLIDKLTDGDEDYLPELTEEEKNEILNPKKSNSSSSDKKPGIFSKALAPVVALAGYMNTGADYIADYSFGYFIESRNLNRFLVYSTIAGISYYIYKKYSKKDQPAFDLFDDTN